MGWVLIGVAGLNIFANVVLTVCQSIKDIWTNNRQRRFESKVSNLFAQRKAQRKKLTKECPEKAGFFTEQETEEQ